jgi:hypothetical protein
MRRALLLNGYLHCVAFVVGMDLFWLVGSILRVRAVGGTQVSYTIENGGRGQRLRQAKGSSGGSSSGAEHRLRAVVGGCLREMSASVV